jgi:hypothetical protein
MDEKVKIIAKNPMFPSDPKFLEITGFSSALNKKSVGERDELTIISNCLLKISYLLAVGYGEAGENIITQNISKNLEKGGIDVEMKGNKVVGIFGFCDIRNFTDTTEVLQNTVMSFVNQIADVVHSNVV